VQLVGDTSEIKSKRTILAKITEFYTFHKVIGHGNFGVVREATRDGVKNDKHFAVKSINKDTLKNKLKKVK
jgi:hypothetical protein